MDLKAAGALARAEGSQIFMRMTACGQTMEHSPHWMQVSGSQTGISSAMLRFSYFVVADGQVPSTGNFDTGICSPRPAMISPITSFTKAGESAGTGASMCRLPAVFCGVAHRLDARAGQLHRLHVHLDDVLALVAVGVLDGGA